MSSRNRAPIPDAWDDDWETQADRGASLREPSPPPAAENNPSKQERMKQHAEANRKLWESADAPQTFHYLEASGGVPLSSAFKPQVKVLSRKPMIAKRDPATGLSQLSLDDDEEKPVEEQLSAEEIRAKQKKEREERQRKYDEARAKIFGQEDPSSRGSSPGTGTVTPPRSDGRNYQQGRGRGRGGYRNNTSNHNNSNNSNNSGGGNSNSNNNSSSNNNSGSSNSHNSPGARQFESRRPNIQPAPTRELFDPNSSPKPEPAAAGSRRGGASGTESHSRTQFVPFGRDEQQAIRAPRGPDGSGRGGFGFARRGARET